MWQGWIALLDGLWLTSSSLFWRMQTNTNLLISGAVLLIFGFWARKNWEGVMLAMIGIWVAGCGFTNYLELSINFFLTGISVAAVALLCATINIRPKPGEFSK